MNILAIGSNNASNIAVVFRYESLINIQMQITKKKFFIFIFFKWEILSSRKLIQAHAIKQLTHLRRSDYLAFVLLWACLRFEYSKV